VAVSQNLIENVQLRGSPRFARRNVRNKYLPHSADKGGFVFAADFAILVAVPIVETCLAHGALHCPKPRASSRRGRMATKLRSRNHVYARHHQPKYLSAIWTRPLLGDPPQQIKEIDPETRHVVQNIYFCRVEKIDGELYSSEFVTFQVVKDPIKETKRVAN
jgi:hypothetical protein